LQAPEEDIRPFAETGRFTHGVSTIYGMIRRLDQGVAAVLQVLRQHGLEDNGQWCYSPTLLTADGAAEELQEMIPLCTE